MTKSLNRYKKRAGKLIQIKLSSPCLEVGSYRSIKYFFHLYSSNALFRQLAKCDVSYTVVMKCLLLLWIWTQLVDCIMNNV